MEPGYIENQKKYSNIKGSFGPWGNLADNGCGGIALYNVLRYYNQRVDFNELVRRINKSWIFSVGMLGLLGTNPLYILYDLKKNGFQIEKVRSGRHKKSDFCIPPYSACIVLYFWKKGRKIGAHYQAVFPKPDGALEFHNPNETYETMEKYLVEKTKRDGMFYSAIAMIRPVRITRFGSRH